MTGVAITTHNRRPTALKTVSQVLQHTPGVRVVVVDDGSDVPFPQMDGVEVVRHDRAQGIARAKNRCLAELEDCEHLMLLDDDCYPTADGWLDLYINACLLTGCQHFVHMGGQPVAWRPLLGTVEIGGQALTNWGHPAGVGLFVSQQVLRQVGGLDPRYGIYGREHIGYSWRIHNAGLTPHPFLDVLGSENYLRMVDMYPREKDPVLTVPIAVRRRQGETNRWLLDEERTSAEWKSYRA